MHSGEGSLQLPSAAHRGRRHARERAGDAPTGRARGGQAHAGGPRRRVRGPLLRQHHLRVDPRAAVHGLDRMERAAGPRAFRSLPLHLPHAVRVAGGHLPVVLHPDQPELRDAHHGAAQPAGPADQPAPSRRTPRCCSCWTAWPGRWVCTRKTIRRSRCWSKPPARRRWRGRSRTPSGKNRPASGRQERPQGRQLIWWAAPAGACRAPCRTPSAKVQPPRPLRHALRGDRDQLLLPPPAPARAVREVGGGGAARVPLLRQAAQDDHARTPAAGLRALLDEFLSQGRPGRQARLPAGAAATELVRCRRPGLPRKAGRAFRRRSGAGAPSCELVHTAGRSAAAPRASGPGARRSRAARSRSLAGRMAATGVPAPARLAAHVLLVL